MKTTVLIVDDEEMLGELLGEYLGANGFEVSVAHDADGALERLKAERFDAVLCDQNLGVGPLGTELLASARAQHLVDHTAWLLLTGLPPSRFANEGVTVVQKPFELEPLMEIVRRCVARSAEPSLAEVQEQLLEGEHAAQVKRRVGRALTDRRERLEHSSRALNLGRVAAQTAELLREGSHPSAHDRRDDEVISCKVSEVLGRLEGETRELQREVDGLLTIARKLGLAF